MEPHEYANLFPMLPDAELARLAEDIKLNGQKEYILSFEGKILDGRNRYKACQIAGVEPRIVAWVGPDPLGEVISRNLHRRHLTPSQAGMIAQEAAQLRRGAPVGNENNSPTKSNTARAVFDSDSKTMDQAAKDFGISADTVQRARTVAEHGVPELIEAVKDGSIPVKAAAVIAKTLTPEQQQQVVANGTQAVKDAAREVREYGEYTAPDTTESPANPIQRTNYAMDDAARLWAIAKVTLDKILKNDQSRVRVLNEVIEYAKQRIESRK